MPVQGSPDDLSRVAHIQKQPLKLRPPKYIFKLFVYTYIYTLSVAKNEFTTIIYYLNVTVCLLVGFRGWVSIGSFFSFVGPFVFS